MTTEVLTKLSDVKNTLGEMAGRLQNKDFREAFTQLEHLMEETHRQYFNNRAGPDGTPWDEWHFTGMDGPFDHPTLEVSGRLRESLTVGGQDNVSFMTQRSFRWGSNLVYAGIHNSGATIILGIFLRSRDGKIVIPPGTPLEIPQREFMGVGADTVERMAIIVLEHVMTTLRE